MWVSDDIIGLVVGALLAISIPVVIIFGIVIRIGVKRGVRSYVIVPFALFMTIAALAAIIGWHFVLFGVGVYGEAYVLVYLIWIIMVIASSILLTVLVTRRFGRPALSSPGPSKAESSF